jgi:hypothetical protein
MTRLQATATLAHGLGLDAHGACVPSKHIVYTKALQVTPSTGHQLMHDLYRQLEDPALHDVFYGPDGHVKRVQHWRVDGGGNEAVKSLLNRILWTKYMEQCNIDVLMVTHCESNGNIRELVERMQACITHAQAGHVLPYDERSFADEATGAVDADRVKGYHVANNAEYASWLNNAQGLHGQPLIAKKSHQQVDAESTPKCPVHFFDRAQFFYQYFHSNAQNSTTKRQALIAALKPEQQVWATEVSHLLQVLNKHTKHLSRYAFVLHRCAGGDINCPSVQCIACHPWVCPEAWCDDGPPTSEGLIFPRWDPQKEGSYMTPVALWLAYRDGHFTNIADAVLPSKLLEGRWRVLAGSNKKKALTLAEANSVAIMVKDSYITPQRVFDYFKKQRLTHLRTVAGRAKSRVTAQDKAAAVPLCATRTVAQRRTTSKQPRIIHIDVDEKEEEEEGEEHEVDDEWPYTIGKAEEMFKVVHIPNFADANDKFKLVHLSGQHAGKIKKQKVVGKGIMWCFAIEGWCSVHISSVSDKAGLYVNMRFKDDPTNAAKEHELRVEDYGKLWYFAERAP